MDVVRSLPAPPPSFVPLPTSPLSTDHAHFSSSLRSPSEWAWSLKVTIILHPPHTKHKKTCHLWNKNAAPSWQPPPLPHAPGPSTPNPSPLHHARTRARAHPHTPHPTPHTHPPPQPHTHALTHTRRSSSGHQEGGARHRERGAEACRHDGRGDGQADAVKRLRLRQPARAEKEQHLGGRSPSGRRCKRRSRSTTPRRPWRARQTAPQTRATAWPCGRGLCRASREGRAWDARRESAATRGSTEWLSWS